MYYSASETVFVDRFYATLGLNSPPLAASRHSPMNRDLRQAKAGIQKSKLDAGLVAVKLCEGGSSPA